MTRRLPPLPTALSRAVDPASGQFDPRLYGFLQDLLAVVAESQVQIETLRAGLNEARADPLTVLPDIEF